MKNLNLAKVLITGGAQGIGREQALCFADEGAEIILTDINKEKVEQTRDEISARGTRCWSYVLDVTDQKQVESVRDQIHKDVGKITVLVNNAGVVAGGPFLEVPLEKHLATYKVNVHGPVGVTYAFLDDLISQTDAHLVNIASASGLIGLPFGSTYASSKWAMIGFSESIRLELKLMGHNHVNVTCVCPSYISTGMFDGAKAAKLTKLLEPAALARKVIKAVKSNDVFVYEPWLVKVTPMLKSVLPVKISDLLSDVFGATASMSDWRGHG
jgi:short-subunit dehydrogenase